MNAFSYIGSCFNKKKLGYLDEFYGATYWRMKEEILQILLGLYVKSLLLVCYW